MAAYEQLKPLVDSYMVAISRPRLGWRERNRKIATWLGLGLLGSTIEFGNGKVYVGENKPLLPYIIVGVTTPSWTDQPDARTERNRVSIMVVPNQIEPHRIYGDWGGFPLAITAKQMITSRLDVKF